MTDRDKLIELVEDGFPKRFEILFREDCEELSDYLLANGVIVPPCKVGDVVYFLDTVCCGDNCCYNGTCTECKNSEWQVFKIDFDLSMYYEIGKTVFLTKEEAEEKLKELNNNVLY